MWTFPIPHIDELEMAIVEIWKIIKEFQTNNNIDRYNEEQRIAINSEVEHMVKQAKPLIKWFIYFIQDSYWYIKIGKTVDIKSRLQKYISENSWEIKMIKYIKSEDYTSEEIKFHKMFENKRHKWERFLLDKNDIDFILSLE